jgi:hypothetical protein
MKQNRALIKALQRIESEIKKVERAQMAESRARELAEIKGAMDRERRKRKRLERLTLGATFLFAMLIGVAVWYAQPELVSDSYRRVVGAVTGNSTVQSVDTRDVDCAREEYAGSKVCQDRGRAESNWSGIVLNTGGKEKPFSLHGRPGQANPETTKR